MEAIQSAEKLALQLNFELRFNITHIKLIKFINKKTKQKILFRG